jgi:succinoglycan biosynthesis protein ExoV
LQLYYYQDPIGNFGDDLNPWLWPRLLPKPVEQCFDSDTLFLGIGSILNQKIPSQPLKKIVFGSGFGYGSPPAITSGWRFYCVRGPLTAQVLELPAEKAICDSAILIREHVPPANKTRYRAAYMPHHLTALYDNWRAVCDTLSIHYIDPAAPVEQTLEAIRSSEVVITEAMHGAIVADALRVPWIPVRTRPRIAEFKWRDWSSSLGIEHKFEWLSPVWNSHIDSTMKRRLHPLAANIARERLRWLLRFGKRRLSQDRVFNTVYERLRTAFHEMVTAAV